MTSGRFWRILFGCKGWWVTGRMTSFSAVLYLGKTLSMTVINLSGWVNGAALKTTSPLGAIKNLVKFHLMAEVPKKPRLVVFNSCHKGWVCGPLTSIFSDIKNETPWFLVQNVAISVLEPGSWFLNWLQGKPMICKPWHAYCSWIDSNWVNWGVKPHWLAELNNNRAWPWNWLKATDSPERVWKLWEKMLMTLLQKKIRCTARGIANTAFEYQFKIRE